MITHTLTLSGEYLANKCVCASVVCAKDKPFDTRIGYVAICVGSRTCGPHIYTLAHIYLNGNSIGINDARALTHIYRDYYFFCVAPVPAAVATSDTMRLLSRLLYTVPMLSVTRLLFLLFPISVPMPMPQGCARGHNYFWVCRR